MDQILHTDDSHLAKLGLNDVIGGDGGTVAIDLAIFLFYTELEISFRNK